MCKKQNHSTEFFIIEPFKGLKAQVDLMLQAGNATIESIMVGTDTYELYRKLTSHPDPGHKIIGRGEAVPFHLQKRNKAYLPAII